MMMNLQQKRVSWYPTFKEILFPRKKLMDAVVEATGAGTVTVIGGLDRTIASKIWVCLKIVYPYTQWLMIIIPTKWL